MTATAKKTANYEITEHTKIEIINGETRKGRQEIIYTSLLKVSHKEVTKKMKIYIERDSYDHQSKATISVWSTATESWNEVASIPCTQEHIYYQINPYSNDFESGVAARRMKIEAGNLINLASEIVF
jgi:uncharacterized membrane-anchored protein